MKKIIWSRGLIAGVILAALIAVMPCTNDAVSFEYGELIGYTSMTVAFLAIFFGIRSYREQNGGTITFGRAFKVGILITLIASAFYVIAWEIVYYNFMPDFATKFATFTIEKMRADGASAQEILAAEKKMADFQRWYKNPIFNVGMTLVEVFPVGLIVTLVSAAILRRKPDAGPNAAPAVA